MLNQLYTEIILEHNKRTDHRGTPSHTTHTERGHNPSCGDDLTLHLSVEDNIIVDAKFTGSGCALSQASISIMIDLVLHREIDYALELAHIFQKMIMGSPLEQEEKDKLGDAQIFQSLSKMPARVKCGTLGWHCLRVALTN